MPYRARKPCQKKRLELIVNAFAFAAGGREVCLARKHIDGLLGSLTTLEFPRFGKTSTDLMGFPGLPWIQSCSQVSQGQNAG